MDEREYRRLLKIEEAMSNGKTPYEAAISNMSVQSRLDAQRTIDYLNIQHDYETEWKPMKAFWNGLYKQAGRAFIGNMQMRLDTDIARLQEEHPEVGKINSTELAQSYLNKPEASWFNLAPYQIKTDGTAQQLLYGVIEGAGQLASQAIVTVLTGSAGSTAFMGAQIAGNQYLDLRKEGVDADRALNAVLVNAAFQAPMERIGFSKMFRAIPAGSPLKKKAMQVLESAVTEGVTEGLQELPEQMTTIWAKDKNLETTFDVAREWDKNAMDNFKDMVFSGVIGAILGGGASGLNVGLNDIIGRKLRQKVNAAMVENIEENAEQIKASGVNPQYAAADIDGRGAEAVQVDAKAVKDFADEKNSMNQIAERLGVTKEQIEEAAANGQDISVTRGNLTATIASTEGFADATREHISFDDGANSVNYAEMQKDLSAAYEASEQAANELDAELDKIIGSAKEAGMARPHMEKWREMLESRAMIGNPENPAAWLQKHGLRVISEGKARMQGSSLYQNGKLKKEAFYSTNITGNELGSYKDISDLRTKAVEWYKKNLQGTSVYNETLGEIRIGKGLTDNDIALTGGGRRKMTTTSARAEKLLAVRYLKEIIEGSNFVTEAASAKEKHSGENFYYIHSALNVNGEKRYVIVTARELNNKELVYYNHNVFNENEYKKIEDALKPSGSIISNAGQYLESKSSTEDALRSTVPTDSSVGQNPTEQSSFADSISQKAQVYKQQKIVDSYNQTAYHGTPHSFEQFDLGAVGSGVGLQAHGWGLYFTADKKVAEEYKEYTGGKGFVYEADIPENDVLLDAGKTFDGQTAKVKRAINKIIENLSNEELENFDDVGSLGRAKVIRSIKESLADSDGQNIYGTIYDLISDNSKGRDTSLLLNKYGIKGIVYEDKGKRNFVVFDDKAISIINRYNQENNGVQKGAITPQQDGSHIISLFKNADASTVIHETGHYFFDTFMKDSALPEADARMKRDRQRLLDYIGMTEEQWNKASFEQRRAGHEKVAEAFETYIMEGKAPSRKLRSLFNRFSKWLKAVYTKYARSENAAELNPDVREVFDHWLAAEIDIQERARAEGIMGKLPDTLTENLSDKQKEWLEDKILSARDEAVNMLTKQYIRNFSKERRKAIADFRANITPEIEKQVAELQVNRARDAVSDRFARERTKTFQFEAYDVLTIKQKLFLWANPNVVARKYKNSLDPEYRSMQEYLDDLNKEIDDRLNPIIEELKEGYGHGVEERWIDTETGEEVDVSGLGEEKRSGWQYRKERISLNAPWYQNWYKDKGHRPSKAELRELAYDLYTGVDKYGFYADMNLFTSAEEQAEFDAMSAERKAEIDSLIADRDAVKGDEDYKKLKQRSRLSEKDIISFELIADEMGYDSGDAMATAILTEPSARQMVSNGVRQAVNAKFPDVAKERELAEAAQMEALYNDESGVVIALEQQLIEDAAYEGAAKDRSSKARAALAAERKAATEREATRLWEKMSMSEALKASRFAMAERRAAANAQRAIKKGEMEAAAEYKRQQAISHALVRKSVKLKQEVEKNKKFVRKLRTMKKENFGTEQHLNQIGAMLARMGLQRRDYNPNYKTQALSQYLDEMREKLGDMVVSKNEDWPGFILDESNDLRDANGMSIEMYDSVMKTLRQLKTIADAGTKSVLEGKEVFAKENKELVLEALDAAPTIYTPQAGEKDQAGLIKGFLWTRMNADNLFESMDGWTRGFFSKTWYGLLKHCADREATLTMEREERIAAAKNAWLPDRKARKAAAEKRYYDELKASADKHTLVQMLCNMGMKATSNGFAKRRR